MLKFTVNKNNLKEYEEKIIVSEITKCEDFINIKTSKSHGLRNGDFINFKRVDINNKELFNEQFFIDVVDKTNFTIESFEELTFSASTCERVDVYSPLNNEELRGIKIVLTEPSKIFINREVITNFAAPNESDNLRKRRCVGDLVNYNGIFLLKAKTVEGNKYIEYDGKYYNTTENVNFKYKNKTINMNVLVPLTYEGYDEQNVLYWFYGSDVEEIDINLLLQHFQDGVFYYEDARFIKENGDVFNLRKNFSGDTDSYIYTLKNVLDFDFNIEKKYDVSLLKNDYYKDFYVDNVIEGKINEPIDMEKQIFIPSLDRHLSTYVVNEINFKINVRKRKYGWESTLLENEWYGDETGTTSIFDIGFDDNDIKFQKSSLKKSFIRLSFYDTPHRGNQKLLYYSTVFLDSNKIFNDYFAKDKKSDLEFVIKNSFDYSACSEGYYLYLFPKFAKKDIPTTIYLKVEFNHAKYGKTISLVLPSDDDYKNGYTNNNTRGTTGIEKLFNDLYIKVNIMYDSKNNKYVWYIPDSTNNKVNDKENKRITMTLYEPIVYKTN
jgi:hypothetical protein